jgi:hypothetical protein
LKRNSVANQLRAVDALRAEIPDKCQRFGLADVMGIKKLAVKVACLHHVRVKDREGTDTFAHESGRDSANESPGPNAQDMALRVFVLIKAGDVDLPVFGTGDCFSAQLNRGS